MDYYIMLDIGGTNIKSAVLDENGNVVECPDESPSHARECKENIFNGIKAIIENEAGKIKNNGNLKAVGFAFPGPFDYVRGISHIQGIGKYDDIYGLSIPKELKNVLPVTFSTVSFFFLHDVEAFAIGYANSRDAYKDKRIFVVAIGTGAGSAFVINGGVSKDVSEGIPENGWIYNYPYKDSIVDDYVSARAQERLAEKYFKTVISGKVLDGLARKGDRRALSVFRDFGKDLSDALSPFIASFSPDVLVLAGQISKSSDFFLSSLRESLSGTNILIETDFNTSLRVFHGLFHVARGMYGREDA